MSVRQLNTKEELLECGRIQSIAFVSSWDQQDAEKNLETPNEHPIVTFGHFTDDNVLTAAIMFPEFQMRYEDHWVPMVGVGGVASLPEYRFGGAIRQIFQTALRWMWDRGTVFSSLYPFSHTYYRKFGYELCQLSTQYELPVESLSSFRCTCHVRMYTPGQDLTPFQEIYNAHLAGYNLSVQRENHHWENLLGKDPCKQRLYTYLLEDNAGPLAYFVLAAEDADAFSKAGNVKELAFVRPEGLYQALGLLYRLSAQYSKLRLILPGDVPLFSLIPESYNLSPNICDQPMARVIHADKALKEKAPGEGKSYTLRVEDELLPENDGLFQVAQNQGVVSVTKLPDPDSVQADLTLDIRVLTQLLLGYLSLEEALYKPGVVLSSNREILETAFPKRTVFLTEHF